MCYNPAITSIAFSVADQAAGFPLNFAPATRHGMGMRLVAALAKTPDAITVDRSVPFGRVVIRTSFGGSG